MAPRGKAIRRVHNARARVKHHGRHRSTATSFERPSPLPHSLIAWATFTLPDSLLFHQALAGSDLIDESDLSQWDKPPPYHSPPPPNNPEEDHFTNNLVDVMHGRHLRTEKEHCARYAQMFKAGEVSVIQGEIQAAEMKLMNNWDGLNEYVSHMEGCGRHRVMAECYVRWRARKIFNYRHELDLLARAQNPYK
jgi:hypothetical protein